VGRSPGKAGGYSLKRDEVSLESSDLWTIGFGEHVFWLRSSSAAPFIKPVRKAIRASGLLVNDMCTRKPIVIRATINASKAAED
jgi:hypothetical protein